MQDLYLVHHGVEGQHWGKKNGPPYPLDAEGKAELRAQKKAEREEKKINKASRKYEDKMMRDIRGYSGEAKNIARKHSLEDSYKKLSDKKIANKVQKVASPIGVALGAAAGSLVVGAGLVPAAISAAAITPIAILANKSQAKQLERESKALEKVSKMKI